MIKYCEWLSIPVTSEMITDEKTEEKATTSNIALAEEHQILIY